MENYSKIRKAILDHLGIAAAPVRTPDLRRVVGKINKIDFYAALNVLETEGKLVKCEPVRPKDAVRWEIAPEPKKYLVKK